MRHAPQQPTTEQLASAHPLGLDHEAAISRTRRRVDSALRHPETELLALAGACALTNSPEVIARENKNLRRLETVQPNLVTVQRLCTWKPRTNPNDWHGMESTSTEVTLAYNMVTQQAKNGSNVGMEIGYGGHYLRYHSALALGWIGARNNTDTALLRTAALGDRNLPLAIKNGLDGDLDAALQRVEEVNRMREGEGALAVLLYRGGNAATNPRDWGEQYKEAVLRTEGRVIIDFAHGGEMAHDPTGNYGKSVGGQIAAVNHGLTLVSEGYIPAGIMLESSDTPTVVDPNTPHHTGLMQIAQFSAVKGAVGVLL